MIDTPELRKMAHADSGAKQMVYLVWVGAYSDARVVAVFDTQQGADGHASLLNGPEKLGDAHIEEMVLNRVDSRADQYSFYVIGQAKSFLSAPGHGVSTVWRDHEGEWDGRYGAEAFVQHGIAYVRSYGRSSEHALRAGRELSRAILAGCVVVDAEGVPFREVPE